MFRFRHAIVKASHQYICVARSCNTTTIEPTMFGLVNYQNMMRLRSANGQMSAGCPDRGAEATSALCNVIVLLHESQKQQLRLICLLSIERTLPKLFRITALSCSRLVLMIAPCFRCFSICFLVGGTSKRTEDYRFSQRKFNRGFNKHP